MFKDWFESLMRLILSMTSIGIVFCQQSLNSFKYVSYNISIFSLVFSSIRHTVQYYDHTHSKSDLSQEMCVRSEGLKLLIINCRIWTLFFPCSGHLRSLSSNNFFWLCQYRHLLILNRRRRSKLNSGLFCLSFSEPIESANICHMTIY